MSFQITLALKGLKCPKTVAPRNFVISTLQIQVIFLKVMNRGRETKLQVCKNINVI